MNPLKPNKVAVRFFARAAAFILLAANLGVSTAAQGTTPEATSSSPTPGAVQLGDRRAQWDIQGAPGGG